MKIRRDANGIHLFDRSTGLNLLVDEAASASSRWDHLPRFASIALTNVCDLHCSFCYAPKHPAQLRFETVMTWAKELDAGGTLGVGFGGGEPTLYPNFALLCQRLASETELAVSFTTHGHRLSEGMAGELRGYVHFIRVSMDGVGGTYSNIRGRSFSNLLEKLDLIRSISPFGVNYVVNAATVGELDDAAALAFERGAFEMLLLPERPVGGVGGLDDATLK